MRTLLFALFVSAIAFGCEGKPLTGPEAQRVIKHYKNEGPYLPSDPLIIVDGVRVPSEGHPLHDLDPADIEAVEIVKGPAALKLYGPDGSRGAILITTKRAAPRQVSH